MRKIRSQSRTVEAREGTENIWVSSYGDMMTFLMIFFLILWAYTQFVQKKEIVTMPSPTADTPLRREIKEELEQVGTVVMTRRKVTVTLPSAVLFDSGSNRLRTEALASLDKVAAVLHRTTAPVVVEGHTDDVPIRYSKWRSNYELSAARAFSVIRYFTRRHDIAPERCAARGYGPHRALWPNNSEIHRSRNRRIEIHLWVS